MRVRSRSVVLSLAVMAIANSALAGTILINDLAEGFPIVTGSGGAIVADGSLSCTLATESCIFTVTPPAGATSYNVNFNIGVNVFDPGGLVVSDTLQQGDCNVDCFLFNSDLEGGPPLIGFTNTAGVNNLTENGNPQNAITITYFDINGLPTGQTDVIQIQSDIDAVTPEPSTWLMMLTGLALLAIPMLRRRISSPAA